MYTFYYALNIFCEFLEPKCDASKNDWHCCTSSSPCGIDEGDCDKDSHCAGGLVCGSKNCKKIDPAWSSSAFDCCMNKGKKIQEKSF